MAFCVYHLHPTSIAIIPKTFSELVLGATLPNPTDEREVNVKYKAVMYFVLAVGPLSAKPNEKDMSHGTVCLKSSQDVSSLE